MGIWPAGYRQDREIGEMGGLGLHCFTQLALEEISVKHDPNAKVWLCE